MRTGVLHGGAVGQKEAIGRLCKTPAAMESGVDIGIIPLHPGGFVGIRRPFLGEENFQSAGPRGRQTGGRGCVLTYLEIRKIW